MSYKLWNKFNCVSGWIIPYRIGNTFGSAYRPLTIPAQPRSASMFWNRRYDFHIWYTSVRDVFCKRCHQAWEDEEDSCGTANPA